VGGRGFLGRAGFRGGSGSGSPSRRGAGVFLVWARHRGRGPLGSVERGAALGSLPLPDRGSGGCLLGFVVGAWSGGPVGVGLLAPEGGWCGRGRGWGVWALCGVLFVGVAGVR